MRQKLIQIHKKDNVAVAVEKIVKGDLLTIAGRTLCAREEIPAGHKIAIKPIDEADPIVKYGHRIGHAVYKIEAGEWVHTHNLATNLKDQLEYTYQPTLDYTEELQNSKKEEKDSGFFMAYRRADGKVGIRNEIWIIPTVGCVNNIVTALAKNAAGLKSEQIEDVVAFTHPYGCSQLGEDQENTRKILAALIRHPNAGGVLVVGLGCENSGIGVLKNYLGSFDEKRIRFLNCQDYEDEMQEGARILKELASYVQTFTRTRIPVSELMVGLKCGGSDGFSGLTANPVVGRFSDHLIQEHGTTILTEVPEMFGAETILMNRCKDEETFQKTVDMINDYKDYYQRHGQTIYENPSPGNKMGGISTLEDKSLGCTQKSGDSKVCGVYAYGEQITGKGLNLLSAPGNDLVAATALAAAGAQLILFTTGRGTPFAAPVPTLKIASNSDLAKRKTGWIDFDAGRLLTDETMDTLEQQLFDLVLRTASGELTKSERAGYHDMAILKGGVTL